MLRLSTKQKREFYSISSLLLHLIIFIALLVSLNSCGLISPEEEVTPGTCTTLATMKDMRGLDGCGFILVLDDGQRLEPVQPNFEMSCFAFKTPSPLWGDVEPQDGKRVRIGYQETSQPSICMLGKTIMLTCITEVSTSTAALN